MRLSNGVIFPFRRLSYLDIEDMKAILSNSYETITLNALRKHLRSGDIFIDVGANVGYISAVAASCVGERGEVHAFEPLSECFQRLELLRDKNKDYRFVLNPAAVGDQAKVTDIHVDMNQQSRCASAVMSSADHEQRSVNMIRLDEYVLIHINDISRIRMVKIDVEGFEFSVLKGMRALLENRQFSASIICEINPWIPSRLSYTLRDIEQYMQGFGYSSRKLDRPQSKLDLPSLQRLENVLFMKTA